MRPVAAPGVLLSEVRAVNFRSARRLKLEAGPICAAIGEPGAGKSNLLLALRALLDPSFDVSETDITFGERVLSIEATLADGRTISLDDRTGAPPIVHFPTSVRGGGLVSGARSGTVQGLIQKALARAPAPRTRRRTAANSTRSPSTSRP